MRIQKHARTFVWFNVIGFMLAKIRLKQNNKHVEYYKVRVVVSILTFASLCLSFYFVVYLILYVGENTENQLKNARSPVWCPRFRVGNDTVWFVCAYVSPSILRNSIFPIMTWEDNIPGEPRKRIWCEYQMLNQNNKNVWGILKYACDLLRFYCNKIIVSILYMVAILTLKVNENTENTNNKCEVRCGHYVVVSVKYGLLFFNSCIQLYSQAYRAIPFLLTITKKGHISAEPRKRIFHDRQMFY